MRYMLITTTNVILGIVDNNDGTSNVTHYFPSSKDYETVLPLVTERFTPQEEVSPDPIFIPK